MNGAICKIDVFPLQAAAFAPAHPSGDNQLKVGFIFDAFFLQSGDQPLRSFLVGDVPLLLFPSVFIGAPRRVMIQKAALHGVGEDPAKTGVDPFHRALGERLSVIEIFLFPHFSVKASEMFRPQVGQLDIAQKWQEPVDILLVADEGGFGQLIRRYLPQPDFNVFCQGNRFVDFQRSIFALALEKRSFLLQPLFPSLGR